MDTGKVIGHDATDLWLAKHFNDVVIELREQDIPSEIGEVALGATYRNDSAHTVTSEVNKTIEQLLQLKVPLQHLRVRARDLEDLFLELTGKELRT